MTLREIRKAKGLSALDVSRMVGVDPSMINRLENFKNPVSIKVARRISKLYGVSLDTIYAGFFEDAADDIHTINGTVTIGETNNDIQPE